MKTYSPGTVMLLVGTKRGLFLLSSQDRERWTVDRHTLAGKRVYHAVLDTRAGTRMFATDNGDFWGTFLRYSDDFGDTWQEPEQNIQFPAESGSKLENIWIIEPGRADEPDAVYVGVDPASLWESRDRGATWELNQGLFDHPTRPDWNPGAGGLCLHSIVPDYARPERMWIGISAVGCLRTDDGGQTWQFANRGTRADFQPDRYPEWGQCIHRLVQHPSQPDTLYQQNHCGVYSTSNAGEQWTDIQSELPGQFGFPIALDAHNPETLFTIVETEEGRHNFENQFTVYRTEDAGGAWTRQTEGLPGGSNVKLGVLHHGMCADTFDPCGVYVGTNTGQLFASNDRGDHWELIADFLPPIYSVRTAVIP